MYLFIPIELQEGILVAIIISIQFFVFLGTWRKIRVYQNILEDAENAHVLHPSIPVKVIEEEEPRQIINNIGAYLSTKEEETGENQIMVNVPYLYAKTDWDSIFGKILFSINIYLLRNKGAVTDFNLVKDIVERNTDAVDDDIRITLPIPLYLGLMGTMLGIVIGLFNMPDLGINLIDASGAATVESAGFTEGINVLLSGVRIAMIASFSGLFLTTLNSGLFYKGSKSAVEVQKNNFYTFIQTELLPVLSQNVGASLHKLHINLVNFNQEFTINLNDLKGLMIKNYDTLKMQDRILQKLEGSNFNQLIKSNIYSFQKIQKSVEQLERSSDVLDKFNGYLLQMNNFISSTQQLNNQVLAVLKRTDNFEEIATNVKGTLAQSHQLQSFLNSHFSAIESRGSLIQDAVITVDEVLTKSLDGLRVHVQEKIKEIREFSINEQDKMEKALEANSRKVNEFFNSMQSQMEETMRENQSSFRKLDYLEKLNENFAQFMKLQQNQNHKLAESVNALHTSSKETMRLIKAERKQVEQKVKFTQFSRGLSWAFQIVSILFFLSIATLFLIDRFG